LFLGIFRVALLFICQGPVCCLSAATRIIYHTFISLSTRIFTFFDFFISEENLTGYKRHSCGVPY
ncbi:MAG: hypothetical protein LUH07_16185, partial [Lachnospiraceae bacterium]|nr:hypothetical protein [Lachnospiraceae bacterium]